MSDAGGDGVGPAQLGDGPVTATVAAIRHLM